MKKTIFLLGLQAAFAVLNAQYSLQPMLPTKGMIQKSNLWNVLVINSSEKPISGRLELVLRDRSTGMEQITASSNQITVEKGAKQLNNALLMPIQYNFLNVGMARQNQDLIPIGNYTACYRFSNHLDKGITFAEECVQFDVEPLSPPMLITPSDNAEVPIQPTQFSWSPPAPIGLFNQLKYDIVMVELLPDQKADEAIQQNIPIYLENNTLNNFINYKGSKLVFKKDKTYAWQVVAKDNNEYAAKSEVWSFKVKDLAIEKSVKVGKNYISLSDEINGLYQINTREINVKYVAKEGSANAKIVIKDNSGREIERRNIAIKNGDNYYELKLNKRISSGKIYYLNIDGLTISSSTLSFIIKEK